MPDGVDPYGRPMDRTAGLIDRSTRRRVALAVVLIGAFVGVAAPPTAASAPAPTEVSTADWRQVSAGDNHSCGVRVSGRLYCWGIDGAGQLGDGPPFTDQSAPVEVAGGAANWASVDAGGSHTCARKTNGRLFCWGQDVFGQVGNGAPYVNQDTPVQVAGGDTDWASVSAGGDHTCARKTTGQLFCWGADHSGQVGDGGPLGLVFALPAPVEVFGGATDWASVRAAGRLHTCARRTTGQLFCWGADGSGQLGNGSPNNDEAVPVEVLGAATTWSRVSAGVDHTCARKTTGRLLCWGDDASGQLGNGGGVTADQPAPVQVAGGTADWVSVSAGGRYTCGRRTQGRLFCWGSDALGQLGNGPLRRRGPAGTGRRCSRPRTGAQSAPASTATPAPDGPPAGCSAGASTTQGQLGNGSPNSGTTAPIRWAEVDRATAIEDLSPRYGDAVLLAEAGHDHESIAARLDIAPESVPALLEIAEAKLARLLQGD